jgi:predicted nucleic acid-binding protein
MGALIDSTVLIAHERGRLDLPEKIAQHEDEEFFISVITASEILHGVRRAGPGRGDTEPDVEDVLMASPHSRVEIPWRGATYSGLDSVKTGTRAAGDAQCRTR